jgi:hypothetical protein
MVGAAEAAALFAAAAKRPGKRRLRKLYAAVSDDSGLQYVCGLIGYLRFLGPDLGCIYGLSRWLALTGSDRGAVKIGIALLGVTYPGPDLAVVRRARPVRSSARLTATARRRTWTITRRAPKPLPRSWT